MNPHQYDFATPNRKRGFLVFSALGLIKTALKSCQAFPFNTQHQEECVCHGITLSNHKTFLSSLKAHPPHGSNSLGALTSASGRNPPHASFFRLYRSVWADCVIRLFPALPSQTNYITRLCKQSVDACCCLATGRPVRSNGVCLRARAGNVTGDV